MVARVSSKSTLTWIFRIRTKIVDPYNKIVSRITQLARLQVSHTYLQAAQRRQKDVIGSPMSRMQAT